MTRFNLGDADEARATLAHLRELMKDPAWAGEADTKALAAEAEALLDPPSTSQPSDPPPPK